MALLPSGHMPASRLLQWLALSTITHLHLTRAETAISTLFVPDTDTIVSINLPPGSDDINLYVSTPDFYQYTAIGFGSSMADALMLVMYPSANRQSVTVSPRLATGNTEPVWSSSIRISLHESTAINDNSDMVVNATCHSCRALGPGRPSIRASTETPMMFAVGPNPDLISDDPDARIRRHVAYAQFKMDLIKATGPGGIGAGVSGSESSSMTLTSDMIHRDENRAATAHGILYAIVALAVAPFDSLIAGFLGSRWAWLHGATASFYFAFVIGATVPGIIISRQHVATQQFRTPHQVIGLLTFVAISIMFFWGFALSCIKRSAKKRDQQPPESTAMLGAIHKWVCRLVWVLLLVNVGLGLKLSEHKLVVLLGYMALALGVVIILVPVYFCLWRCTKRRKEKEDGLHELTIYDHNYR